MYHFQAKKTRYQTAFDKSEAPVIDAEPPFARVAILPLPKAANVKEQAAGASRAARGPVPRNADPGRPRRRRGPRNVPHAPFRAGPGVPDVRPVPPLLAAAGDARRRDPPLRPAADPALDREGRRPPPRADRRLADAAVGRAEAVFEDVVELVHSSVRDIAARGPGPRVRRLHRPPPHPHPGGGKLDAASACTVLDQLIKVVGKPDCENDPLPGSLHDTLDGPVREVAEGGRGHLAVMAATFLEVPQFRLPGAEEAVRQIAEQLKHQVEVLEPVRDDLDKEVRTTYGRLLQTIGGLGTTSGLGSLSVPQIVVTAEVIELLRSYPRKRLQLHVLDLVLSVFRRLLGNAPEYLREINFCRSTLADMHAALGKAVPTSADRAGAGKLILPDGCKNLDEAADQFLAGLAPEDLLAFEQALQKDVSRKFKGLGSVCLKPLEKGGRFREMLLSRSREFLDGKLDQSDPATMFFRYRTADGSAEPLIGEAYGEATPEVITRSGAIPQEVTLLGVPPGSSGDRFRELASTVLPDIEITAAPLPDDICFYREYPQLDIADLLQLGDHARDAYAPNGRRRPPAAFSLRYLLAAARLTTAGYPFGRAAQILFFPAHN